MGTIYTHTDTVSVKTKETSVYNVEAHRNQRNNSWPCKENSVTQSPSLKF